MSTRFAPSTILPLIEKHTTAVSDVCSDILSIADGSEIYGAMAFSSMFSSLTPRPNLSPINANHHYDLYCQRFFTQLPKISNQIGYKVMMPLGTIGKMINHLLHRKDFIRRCLDNKDYLSVRNAIINEFSPYRYTRGNGSLTSSEVADYLTGALSDLRGHQLRSNIEALTKMLKSGHIRGPGDCYSHDEIAYSVDPTGVIASMRSALETEKRDRYYRFERSISPESEDHIRFEALMDTLNVSLPLRLNSSNPKKKILFFGSQMKRKLYGFRGIDKYSRAMLSLFYWQLALSRVSAKHSGPSLQGRAIKMMNFNKSQFELILKEYRELSTTNEVDIDDGLSDAFTNTIWVPFVKSLVLPDSISKISEDEFSRLARESVDGKDGATRSAATRKILEEASVTTEAALQILASNIDPRLLDIYTYADPSIEDNDRFKQMINLFPQVSVGPKLG